MSNQALIAPHFVAARPTTLVFKQKKNKLDEYINVINVLGRRKPMFKINAHSFSLSEQHTLEDASGTKIGTVRLNRLKMIFGINVSDFNRTYDLGTMSNNKTCKVKEKFYDPLNFAVDIYHGNTVIGEANGDWSRREKTTISLGGSQAARVSHLMELNRGIVDRSIIVEIEGGVDVAFMSMVVIALFGIYHKKERRNVYHSMENQS